MNARSSFRRSAYAAAVSLLLAAPAAHADIDAEATAAIRAGGCQLGDSQPNSLGFNETCGFISPSAKQTTQVFKTDVQENETYQVNSTGEVFGPATPTFSILDVDFVLTTAAEFTMSGKLISTGDGLAEVKLERLSGEAFNTITITAPGGNVEHIFLEDGEIGPGTYRLSADASIDGDFGGARFELGFTIGQEDGTGCESSSAIKGTNGNDTLNGTSGNDVICGLGGDDQINGLGGNDRIYAGEGDDTVDGGAGEDEVYGEGGSDELSGGSEDDLLLDADGARNVLMGGPGDDELFGGSSNTEQLTILCGGEGDDEISGGNGIDYAMGGPGADYVETFNGDDAVWGESSESAANAIGEDACHSSQNGNAADNGDEIDSGGGKDFVSGGPGADVINGGNAKDDICGDHQEVGGNTDPCMGLGEDAELDGDTIDGGRGNEVQARKPGIRGGPGDDFISGGPGDDFLDGGDGDDGLFGEGGSDKLQGAGGRDTLQGDPDGGGPKRKDVLKGGPDNDRLLARDGDPDEADADVVRGDAGSDQASVDPTDTVTSVESFLP